MHMHMHISRLMAITLPALMECGMQSPTAKRDMQCGLHHRHHKKQHPMAGGNSEEKKKTENKTQRNQETGHTRGTCRGRSRSGWQPLAPRPLQLLLRQPPGHGRPRPRQQRQRRLIRGPVQGGRHVVGVRPRRLRRSSRQMGHAQGQAERQAERLPRATGCRPRRSNPTASRIIPAIKASAGTVPCWAQSAEIPPTALSRADGPTAGSRSWRRRSPRRPGNGTCTVSRRSPDRQRLVKRRTGEGGEKKSQEQRPHGGGLRPAALVRVVNAAAALHKLLLLGYS